MIGSTTTRSALLALVLPATALAQFGNEWVGFTQENTRINASPGLVLNDQQEKDYAWGDFDNDGWTDLVIARKQPFTSSGKFANVLLMNESGTLVDRTAQFAANSDVPGDNGFLTPTNDRDVVVSDVDGDGWLDLVTCTTLSAADPKHISHPRVYMNLGEIGGVWQGLRHEDARFPQLLLGSGAPSWPRFCAVDAGDVTGDGFPDLYFADYDSGGSGGGDMNDRLLINDGTGHFTDESFRMSALMLSSNFGASADIVDMNGDGVNDVVKDSGLTAFIRISYNNPNSEGNFNLTDSPSTGAPYFTSVGDLNNDDRLDFVVSDDGADRMMYNIGNDGLGRAQFGPSKTFSYLPGSGDDGFAGNSLIVDLDLDGWNDVIITDVDVDISGCSRRTHIYHNPGGTPGAQLDLLEEAQQSGGSGWKGVVGMTANDLRGTHDVAVFDIDNDGDPDMVFGLCSGTDVWMNTLDPSNDIGTPYCVAANNSTGSGAEISATGSESVAAEDVTLDTVSLPANQPGVFFFGLNQVQNPFGEGFLCATGSTTRINPPAFANASGEASRAIDFSIYGSALTPGSTWNFQFWYRDPAGGGSGFNLSNGLSVTFLP